MATIGDSKDQQQVLPFVGGQDDGATAQMTLCNMTPRRIVYKVKSNQHGYIKISPFAVGALETGEDCLVDLTINKEFDWDKQECKILIQSAYIPDNLAHGDHDLDDLWPKLEHCENTHLKAVYATVEQPDEIGGDGDVSLQQKPSLPQITTLIMEHHGKGVPVMKCDAKPCLAEKGLRMAKPVLEPSMDVPIILSSGDAQDLTEPAPIARFQQRIPQPMPGPMMEWFKEQPPEVVYPCTLTSVMAAVIGLLVGVIISR